MASISLDLDNQWSYMKTHGDSGWEKFPSYLDLSVPIALKALDRWNLKITFFIVGKDAALKKNKKMLKSLTENGHEVGNHSFSHEPWFHVYPRDRLKREILDAEDQIYQVTGQRPLGFRGPGFSWSPELFEVLVENHYVYDASTLPTYLGPLARWYYFSKSNIVGEKKNQREDLFGGLKNGLKPSKAHQWHLPSGARLLEIPVTTLPFIKTPFHLSYLLYLARFSLALMSLYLNTALVLCKMTGTEPSFLLHPLDFLGGDQVPELTFFPGMDLSRERKIQLFDTVMRTLCENFDLVNMSTHANSLLKKDTLKVVPICT